MSVERQLSIFLENEPGALAHLSRRLAHAHVNIVAVFVPESSDQGVLRLVVDDPNQAKALLKKEGIPFAETQVLALRMPNQPGALFDVTRKMAKAGIDIKYAYGTTNSGDHTMIIFHVSDLSQAVKLFDHPDRHGAASPRRNEKHYVNRSMR